MSRHVSLKFTLAAVFVVALVAFLAGSYSAPTPATAQAPIRWKVQTAWPPTSIVQDAAKLLVETIEKTSGGRLKMDLLPAGAIVRRDDQIPLLTEAEFRALIIDEN